MAKTKKAAKGGKSDKAKLAAGAEEIRKAQKQAKTEAPPEPVVIPESTRPIQEIINERVTVLPGHIGLKLADATPIEESLRILDWTTTLSDHVGFMIGDVLNFGSSKWGDKYKAALNQTGRAQSTLWGYSEAARRIPAEDRVASLTFTHHREILRIGNDEKIKTVLKKVGEQADKGVAPTIKELRIKVQKLTPRKKKAPKKVTSGKGKKGKQKPEPPPYEPSADEQSKMDVAEAALGEANEAIKSGGVFKIVGKCDNKEKRRWLSMIEPLVTMYNNLDKITGY